MDEKEIWFIPAESGLAGYWYPTKEEYIKEIDEEGYEFTWSCYVHELLKSCAMEDLVMFNASEEVFNDWKRGYVALSEHIKKVYPELEISTLDLDNVGIHVRNLQFKKDGNLIGTLITVLGICDFSQVLLIKSEYQDGFVTFFEGEEYPEYL